MPQTSKRAILIVVQHTKDQRGWSYRLIAYEDSRTYLPLDFDVMDALVRTVRFALPDFAQSDLAINENAARSYVAFSADLQLDDGELFLLGLNPASGSWR